MRIFPTSNSSGRRGAAGFTIIELMLVLSVLAMMMFLAVPSFQSLLQDSLDKEVNRLGSVIRLVRNEAILTRKAFRLVVDLKQAAYEVEEADEFGRFVSRADPKLLRPYRLPGSFKLTEMVVFGSRFDRERDRKVPVTINPAGFVDPFSLHFLKDGEPWTLLVKGFSARLSLEKGLVDLRREDL